MDTVSEALRDDPSLAPTERQWRQRRRMELVFHRDELMAKLTTLLQAFDDELLEVCAHVSYLHGEGLIGWLVCLQVLRTQRHVEYAVKLGEFNQVLCFQELVHLKEFDKREQVCMSICLFVVSIVWILIHAWV